MTRYLVESRDQIFVIGHGFLFFCEKIWVKVLVKI